LHPRSRTDFAKNFPRGARLALLAAVLATLIASPGAFAGGNFYLETGLGASQIISGSSLFMGHDPTRLGIGLNSSLMASFEAGNPVINLQTGVQLRFSSATGDTGACGLLELMPVARLQVSRAFVGVGLTPLVWRRVGDAPGLDSYLPPPEPFAIMAEAGVLWPVVPIFSLGVLGSAEWIRSHDVVSPSPDLQVTVLLRFYFGFWRTPATASNEFRGWRYPFGNPLN
jgi:hypothetical protein